MTDSNPKPPHIKPTLADGARWMSDLHCLWRYCEQRGCQRAHTCKGDPGHCLHFLPLVPIEARRFIQGWDDAQADGLSWEEMMEDHAQEWQTLMRWHEMVHATLPENRRKETLSR
jgi:hypothetical protein